MRLSRALRGSRGGGSSLDPADFAVTTSPLLDSAMTVSIVSLYLEIETAVGRSDITSVKLGGSRDLGQTTVPRSPMTVRGSGHQEGGGGKESKDGGELNHDAGGKEKSKKSSSVRGGCCQKMSRIIRPWNRGQFGEYPKRRVLVKRMWVCRRETIRVKRRVLDARNGSSQSCLRSCTCCWFLTESCRGCWMGGE